jgi:hypothetical protein
MKTEGRLNDFLDSSILACIIFLIIFTPLAFGSVGIGSQLILISVCQCIFLLWLTKGSSAKGIFFSNTIFYYLFIAFIVLIILQTVPLPKFLLKISSPSSYKTYMEFLPGYADRQGWHAISIYPEAAKIEFAKLLSLGLVVFVIVNNFNKKSDILAILTAISATGFLTAFFGIVQRFAWNGMIYWVQPVPEGAGPFGPFVNKNHFAGFMELTIPITVAFVFISDRLEKKIFFGFMSTVMLLALFLSLSRAGILSFFTSIMLIIAVLFLRYFFTRSDSARGRLVAYIVYIVPAVLIISSALFLIARGPLIERFSNLPESFMGRAGIYKDAFRMFLDFPLFGTGLATFGNIFSSYNTSYSQAIVRSAHSDWLQMLSEAGLAGFICVLIFIWAFFKDILYCHFLGRGDCIFRASLKDRTVGLRHDRFILIIMLAGFSSLTSIILHGIFEINLHIPSNGFLAVIIGAVLISAIHNISSEKNQVN